MRRNPISRQTAPCQIKCNDTTKSPTEEFVCTEPPTARMADKWHHLRGNKLEEPTKVKAHHRSSVIIEVNYVGKHAIIGVSEPHKTLIFRGKT